MTRPPPNSPPLPSPPLFRPKDLLPPLLNRRSGLCLWARSVNIPHPHQILCPVPVAQLQGFADTVTVFSTGDPDRALAAIFRPRRESALLRIVTTIDYEHLFREPLVDANGDGLGNAQRQIRTPVAWSLFSDFHNSWLFAKHVSDGFHIDAPSLSEIG